MLTKYPTDTQTNNKPTVFFNATWSAI